MIGTIYFNSGNSFLMLTSDFFQYTKKQSPRPSINEIALKLCAKGIN